MVRGETDKKTNDLQTRHFVARDLRKICLTRRNAKKTKSGLSKKTKLDNARKLRGIHFIDPGDEEFNQGYHEECA